MSDHVMSVRAVAGAAFIADVGPTRFLQVPSGQPLTPAQAISAAAWACGMRRLAANLAFSAFIAQ
ncbi:MULTISPECIES: hypothetical protein [unclassified Pseudomonas]|uniref:hypothetical protein n=1 Tax=unclassified Pseudomonas TaxID=196821 RepID=UPI00047F4E51|nr:MULTISPECIES: hypothetical protein [unclassified Pseudomonas]RAS28528.1 hypothetical protein H040_01981 [Pseudomonas sp. URMO17WK12:I7]SMF18322.1 hypothetical protein SAMN02745903_01916 [Pseudomonas sp. URMO17WK12:I5]